MRTKSMEQAIGLPSGFNSNSLIEKVILYLIVVLFLTIYGCMGVQKTSRYKMPREAVLQDGMKICANSVNDYICITACKNNQRIISWEGNNISITLMPRKERWHGTLGLVSPIEPKNIWKSEGGIIRILMQEAQTHYESIESVLQGINFSGRYELGYNVVYNDDGLLLIWDKTEMPDHIVLGLSLSQILINGEKPKTLPGSQNNKISLSTLK
jgi:hypothetical protein